MVHTAHFFFNYKINQVGECSPFENIVVLSLKVLSISLLLKKKNKKNIYGNQWIFLKQVMLENRNNTNFTI